MPFVPSSNVMSSTPVQKKSSVKTPKAPKKPNALSKSIVEGIGNAVTLFRRKNDKTDYINVTDFDLADLDDITGTIKACINKEGTSFVPFRVKTLAAGFTFTGSIDHEKVFTNSEYDTPTLVLGFLPSSEIEGLLCQMFSQIESIGKSITKATHDLIDGDMKIKLKLDDKFSHYFDDSLVGSIGTTSPDDFVGRFLEFTQEKTLRVTARFGVAVLEPNEKNPDYSLGIYVNVQKLSLA